MFLGEHDDEKNNLLETQMIGKNHVFDIDGTYLTFDKQYKVPEFIVKKQSFLEKSKLAKVFCCCMFLCIDYQKIKISNIPLRDLEAYYNLKQLSSQHYDENNKMHEESLSILYINIFKTDPPQDLRHSNWKNVGFQVNFIIFKI